MGRLLPSIGYVVEVCFPQASNMHLQPQVLEAGHLFYLLPIQIWDLGFLTKAIL